MTIRRTLYPANQVFTPRGQIVSTTPHGWERDPQLDKTPPNAARIAATAALVCGFTLWQPFGSPPAPPPPPKAEAAFDRAPPAPARIARIAAQSGFTLWQAKGTPPATHVERTFDRVPPNAARIARLASQVGFTLWQAKGTPPLPPTPPQVEAAFDSIVVLSGISSGLYSSGAQPPFQLYPWRDVDDPFAVAIQKPLHPVKQQFAAFPPRGNVPSPVTPQGWTVAFDWSRIGPVDLRQQQWTGLAPTSIVGAVTYQSWDSYAQVSAPNRRAAELGGQPVRVVPASALVGTELQLGPVGKPLSSAQQRHESFLPQGPVYSVTPQGWERFFDFTIIKPLAPAQQRYEAFLPQGPVYSITPQGWPNVFDWARIAPLDVRKQEWAPVVGLPFVAPFIPRPVTASFGIIVDESVLEQETGQDRASPLAAVDWGWAEAKEPPPSRKRIELAPEPLPREEAVVVQAYLAPVQFDLAAIKPLAVTEQRFDYFQPQGAIVSYTPQGFERFFDWVVVKPWSAAQQQYDAYAVAPVVSYTPQGWERFFDRAIARPTVIYQPDAFAPTPQVSVSYSTQFFDYAQALLAKPQEWASFQPQGQIVSTTPQGWTVAFDWSRIGPVDLRQQQWTVEPQYPVAPAVTPYPLVKPFFQSFVRRGRLASGVAATGTLPVLQVPRGADSFFDRTQIKPLASSLQPLLQDFQPLGTIVVAQAPQGSTAFFDWAAIKPLAASVQRFDYFQPQGTVVSYTPHGWERFAFQSVVRLSPLAISIEQGAPVVSAVVYQAWGFVAEPQRVARPAAEVPGVWRVVVEEVRYAEAFFDRAAQKPTIDHRYDGFTPAGTIVSYTPQGFERFFDWVTVKPWPAVQQQYAAYPVAPVVVTTPQGFERFFDSSIIVPLASELQQFAWWQTLGQVPTEATPQGWERFFDRAAQKPVDVAQQQWAMFAPAGTITVFPIRPPSVQFDIAAIKPLAVTEQRFDYFQPQGEVVSTTPQGWERFFDSIRQAQRPPLFEPHQLKQPFEVFGGFAEVKDFIVLQPRLPASDAPAPQPAAVNYTGWPYTFDWTRVAPLDPRQQQWTTEALYPAVVVVYETPIKASFGIVIAEVELDQGPGQGIASPLAEAANWGWAEAKDPPLPARRAPLAAEPPLLRTIELVTPTLIPAELDRAPRVQFKVAEQPALIRFVPPTTFGFVQPEVLLPARRPLLIEQPFLRFVPPVNFGFVQADAPAPRGLLRPVTELAPLVTPVTAPEAAVFTGWSSELSVALYRRFGPPVEITGPWRFIKLRGFLVCADLSITPAVDATLLLTPAVDGSFTMTPEVLAALALNPAVTATVDLTPEMLAALGIDPAVLATPDVKEC